VKVAQHVFAVGGDRYVTSAVQRLQLPSISGKPNGNIYIYIYVYMCVCVCVTCRMYISKHSMMDELLPEAGGTIILLIVL
jgi:hypothetical protein